MENIVTSLVEYGGVREVDPVQKHLLWRRWSHYLLGAKTGVITELMQKHAPYINGVHCMAHYTNLVIITLNFLRLVSKVESLLARMYNYFAHNPK
jgi:hypothetical protein